MQLTLEPFSLEYAFDIGRAVAIAAARIDDIPMESEAAPQIQKARQSTGKVKMEIRLERQYDIY